MESFERSRYSKANGVTPKVVPLDTVLSFEPGIRLKHDAIRDRHVIQGPEILIELNETGVAIMREIDGNSNLSQVIDRLAGNFSVESSVITQDVSEFCTAMLMKRVLTK